MKNDAAWMVNCQAISDLTKCAKEFVCKTENGACAVDIDKVRTLIAKKQEKGWSEPKEIQFPCPTN